VTGILRSIVAWLRDRLTAWLTRGRPVQIVHLTRDDLNQLWWTQQSDTNIRLLEQMRAWLDTVPTYTGQR
jgi:hypothetical protein